MLSAVCGRQLGSIGDYHERQRMGIGPRSEGSRLAGDGAERCFFHLQAAGPQAYNDAHGAAPLQQFGTRVCATAVAQTRAAEL